MTITTELTHTGIFRIHRDGIRVFEVDPALKTPTLIDTAKITLTGQTITYPQPTRDNWYHYGAGVQTGATTWTGGCTSYTALLGQEYGPGRTNNIADVFLADLPPYTDYIHARIKLTRTVAPDTIMGNPLPTICNGNWIDLGDGAGTIIEGWPGIFVRELAFVIDTPGGAAPKVYLRKLQSVRRFTISGTGWSVLSSNSGVFANVVQNRDPEVWDGTIIGAPPSNWHQRGGTDGCSQGVSGNWASTYSGDIEITPGRVAAP